MPDPIACAEKIFPWRFDSQMRAARAQRGQGVSRGVALQVRLDEMSFQFREGAIKICQHIRQQNRVGLLQHIFESVHVDFDARAACFVAPLAILVINFVEPEKVVHDEVAAEYSRFGMFARLFVEP